MMKNKFVLEFDEVPALVFVQDKVGDRFVVYQDGKCLHGVRIINIYAGIDEPTIHEVEYLTGSTKGRENE